MNCTFHLLYKKFFQNKAHNSAIVFRQTKVDCPLLSLSTQKSTQYLPKLDNYDNLLCRRFGLDELTSVDTGVRSWNVLPGLMIRFSWSNGPDPVYKWPNNSSFIPPGSFLWRQKMNPSAWLFYYIVNVFADLGQVIVFSACTRGDKKRRKCA